MKRTWLSAITLILCLVMVFSLSACGKKTDETPSTFTKETVIIDSFADNTEPVSEEPEDPRATEVVIDDGVGSGLDLDAMQRVDDALAALWDDVDFMESAVEQRVEIAMKVFDELVKAGDIEEDSVFYEDGGDVISFVYKGGVLGGLMLKDWSADMNGMPVD